MKKTLETVVRAIIITILGVVMAGVIFCTTKVLNYTSRGWDLIDAVKDTAYDVHEMLKAEENEGKSDILSYPIVNCNVSWNCLNKKGD